MSFAVGAATGPFAITREDIAGLDDIALRDLLRLLLEAEGGRIGLQRRSIDVGGAQTAPDGGIDAIVRWTGQPEPSGWLYARHIVFQCKATAMPPSAIGKELSPRGILRPFFSELAQGCGAYVIVTTEDVGSSAVQHRIAAMRAELADLDESEQVILDLYAAERLARWTNEHVGVAMWLLEKAGRGLEGWRPFGDWSQGGSGKYLLDEKARAGIDRSGLESSVSDAIKTLRRILGEPRGTARLIGISGMGKTRLAEALFETEVGGATPLLPALAVYGDAGLHLPNPSALVAERLVLAGQRAILVVDNCSDQLHNQLAELVARPGSGVSLLTIDYEIEGERPPGTHIISLGDNSDATIDALLAQRYPELNDSIRCKLVEFAGGNARVALAIGRGVSASDTLSDLNEPGLLDRLFQVERRGGRDMKMRPAAEAAALVYAFYADRGERDQPEHGTLAGVAGLTPDAFYEAVQRMLSFGIAQQRGPQRAVKPDALADSIAATRLRVSNPVSLIAQFAIGPDRLFASFARRVGRLHNEPKACSIAQQLLAEDGWLGQPAEHNDCQRQAFVHLAPAAREAALAAINRATFQPDFVQHGRTSRVYADVLAHIAWDKQLFSQAMRAMQPFALTVSEHDKDKQTCRLFLDRFRPALAFTLASGPTRLAVIDAMLDGDIQARGLGIAALEAMLETGQISSSFQTEFGTRNQHVESGWRSYAERDAWFAGAYKRLTEIARSGDETAGRARDVVSGNARMNAQAGGGLQVVAALRAVRPQGFWDQGWRAVNDSLHFDQDRMTVDLRIAFEQLERELRPHDLSETFDAFVLGEPWRHWHPRRSDKRPVRSIDMLARGCGVAVAAASDDFRPWLERATAASHGQGPIAFAKGLVARTKNLDDLWKDAVAAFRRAGSGNRNPSLLSGILEAAWKIDENWTRARLAEIMLDPDLVQCSVTLHPRQSFDRTTVDRFAAALDGGLITPERLVGLMYGGVSGRFDPEDLAWLLNRIIDQSDGAASALEILGMRLYGDRSQGTTITPVLLAVARRLLADTRLYEGERQRTDYELQEMAQLLLPDHKLARIISRNIVATSREDRWRLSEFVELKKLLVSKHLEISLDEFLGATDDEFILDGVFSREFADDLQLGGNATYLNEAIVLRWISANPQVRAERIAGVIPYAMPQADRGLTWDPLALAVVDAAPNRVPVLQSFERRFYSGTSSGPFYLRFVRQLPLIDALVTDRDPAVRNWARETRENLESYIKSGQEREDERDSRFE